MKLITKTRRAVTCGVTGVRIKAGTRIHVLGVRLWTRWDKPKETKR